MSQNVIDQLRERGLVKQVVFEEDLKKLLDEGPQSFYIGFDPTADSLHVGHFMQMIVAKRLQDAGHRPIIRRDLRQQTPQARSSPRDIGHSLPLKLYDSRMCIRLPRQHTGVID